MFPEGLKYTREHEWARIEDEKVFVGITHHAQEELGDIVFVELPEKGMEVTQGDNLAVVESVKAVSDIYSPVSGKIVEINERLLDEPELINKDPYNQGWIVVIEPEDKKELDELMSSNEYKQMIEEE